jgi:formylglycine-generating enzyme required for sulfatase activity
MRGGAVNDHSSDVRSAYRTFNFPPVFRNTNLGFRAARIYSVSP